MAGYYGKMPSHGDFVSRGLNPAFIRTWDDWLQEIIAYSKSQLGDAWLDVYLTSPLWRFVLSPGVCTDDAWAGVIMPSVDRVGRYFPLTVVHTLPQGYNPIQVATECRAWFQLVETLALAVLESEFERESLDRGVDALTLPPVGESATDPPLSGEAWRFGLHHDGLLGPVLDGFAQRLLMERMGSYSLWWSGGSQRLTPTMLVARGLPAAERFPALLDGQWRRWGWQDSGVFAPLADTSITSPPGAGP